MTTTPATRDFQELLATRWAEGLFVCLGLDPDPAKLPPSVTKRYLFNSDDRMMQALAAYHFCVDIVDATCGTVAAYKPNTAFFEGMGWQGIMMLEKLVAYIHHYAPWVVVILDAKRADIGNTNDPTARFVFDILGADAVTVNPYFGEEALAPFLKRPGKGVIVLCRTSNPGAPEFQSLQVHLTLEQFEALGQEPNEWRTLPLYQYVAHRVAQWKSAGTIAVVVGATAPDEVREVRQILPEATILLPGVGTQGGKLDEAALNGLTEAGQGILVNAGSKVLYGNDGPGYAGVAAIAIGDMNTAIRRLVQHKTT